MCKHCRSSPFVRISHCASVLATGLYSACTGLHLVDNAPPDYCSARRTPPHRPTLAFLPEDAQYPADVEPAITEEDLYGARGALEAHSDADAEDDDFSDTSTIKPTRQYDSSFPAYEDPPGTEPLFSTEAAPIAAHLASTDPAPSPSSDHEAPPVAAPPTLTSPSPHPPEAPTATNALHATTVRWQQENADRRAREEKEAREPWVVRKVRGGVEKARERRRRWVRAVRARRERLWWDWQVWLAD